MSTYWFFLNGGGREEIIFTEASQLMSIRRIKGKRKLSLSPEQSNNRFQKDGSGDANIIKRKDIRKRDIHRISKYLSTDYLLIAKRKRYLYNGEIWQIHLCWRSSLISSTLGRWLTSWATWFYTLWRTHHHLWSILTKYI